MSNKTTLLVSFVALSMSAFAVDGVTLINQATVLGSGGFPYVINQPGSYKLSGNLVVPNTAVYAMTINAPNVTLDMNGFSISCTACTFTSGIDSKATFTSIFNGAINGFPNIAIIFEQAQASVDRLSGTGNGAVVNADGDLTVSNSTFALNSVGINVNGAPSLLVTNSKFIRNQMNAIFAPGAFGAVITGNIFNHNGAMGNANAGAIFIDSGTVTANAFVHNYNVAISSASGGPVLFSQNSFDSFVLSDNFPASTGVVSAGNNSCYANTLILQAALC